MDLNLMASNLIGTVRAKDNKKSDWCESRLRQEVQIVLELVERKAIEKGFRQGQRELRDKFQEHLSGKTHDFEKECFICELLKKYSYLSQSAENTSEVEDGN